MRYGVFIILFILVFSRYGTAQPVPYPQNYFRNPLGSPMEMAANFGELRPNHWHMGLDIRTQQRVNLQVNAAAGGYISHVGIRAQSFGRYIIIDHPNGYSTLYAHLNDFYPELEEYVTAQQYKNETWAIELDLPAGKFPVSKGQFIAYSGNTGGSQGPHLHFEIRDTKTGKCLNPLLFGFAVEDNVPPNLVKLAIYDRSRSIYSQSPLLLTLKNTDSGYIIPKMPVISTGIRKISFGIQAYDRFTGSSNPNGIFSARLSLDDEPKNGFVIDSLTYADSRYMNAHIDYRYRFHGGAFIQHLSRMPGDHGVAYSNLYGDGVIQLADSNVHTVTIDVKDAHRNTSQLKFSIRYIDSLENFSPSFIHHPLIPEQVNVLEKPDFEMYLPEGCIYDTVPAMYYRNNSFPSSAVSALHQVNDESVPLHEDMTVRIKLNKPVSDDLKDKLLIRQTSRGSDIRKGTLQAGSTNQEQWVMAKFDELGSYQVFTDLVPPEINNLGKKDTIDLSPASRIVFQPKDNFGIIKKFRAGLNGKWLRFTNDKTRSYIYVFDERCPYGVHELKVTVEDVVGNTTTRSWWFKRYPYTPKKKVVRKASKKARKKKK